MSENFENLGDLGEKIKDIIDRAVSTKDYRQMTEDIRETVGETVNRAVNSAVDSGGEAIKNGLNSVFGTGNAQSGDHEKYQNKTKEFEERRKREREQAKEQERELARKQQERKRELAVLYEKNTGGKMKGLMLSISGGILASGMGLCSEYFRGSRAYEFAGDRWYLCYGCGSTDRVWASGRRSEEAGETGAFSEVCRDIGYAYLLQSGAAFSGS